MRLHTRLLKDSFATDGEIQRWDGDKKFFYISLIQLAEDSGCIEDDTLAIKRWVFSMQDSVTIEQLEQWVNELVTSLKLIPYEINKSSYFYLKNFHRHQTLRMPTAPENPLPPWITYVIEKTERKAKGVYPHGNYVVDESNVALQSIICDIQCNIESNIKRHIHQEEKGIGSRIEEEVEVKDAPTPLFPENTGKKTPKQKAVKVVDTSNPVPADYPFYQAFWQFSLDELGKPLCASDQWDKLSLTPARIEALMKDLDTKAQKAYSTSGLGELNRRTIRPKDSEALHKASYTMGLLQSLISYALIDCEKEILQNGNEPPRRRSGPFPSGDFKESRVD